MTPDYFAKPLTPYPLPTKDGWTLRTINDVRAYILALPKKRQRRGHWGRARQLLMKEAGAAAVTQQVHLALSRDDELDVLAFEHINSARRWRRAHTSWRRNENEVHPDGIRCCWAHRQRHSRTR